MVKLYYGRNGQVSFKDLNEYYFALGFLADSRRASLYWEHNEDQGAWGSEGRIHCLIPETRFPQNFSFTAGRGSGVYARINCNDYVGTLVTDHKFKVRGAMQDVAKILETVPDQYRDIFMEGYGGKIDLSKVKSSSSLSNAAQVKSSLSENTQSQTTGPTIRVSRGDKVNHKKYGLGIVKKIQGGYIIVTFKGNDDHQFKYPDAFIQGYLEQ